MTFDFDDPILTASGGTCTARYWHIYDDESVGVTDALLCYGLINGADEDVSIGDTETLTLEVPAGGLFTYTQA
jgi:hypothetical protein